MYKALITKITVKPHTNAERLELLVLDSTGEQIVVGKGIHKTGDRVVFFGEGGQLSADYCHNNNEYRENHGINKDPTKSGLFDEKRRIRVIKLRGEISSGYVAPFSAFSWLGPQAIKELESLPLNAELDTLAGHQFCEKYYTRATRERLDQQNKEPGFKFKIDGFNKHFHTSHLVRTLKQLPEKAIYWITDKIHGTSGRTAYLNVTFTESSNWAQRLFIKLIKKLGIREPKLPTVTKPMLISGSRNTDFNPLQDIKEGYRLTAQEYFRNNLHLGETVYYELCHTTKSGKAIQSCGVDKKEEFGKEIAKRYGEHIEYTYGVAPEETVCFVYRITQDIGTSVPLELSWVQILKRIQTWAVPNIRPVPYSDPFADKAEIEGRVKEYIANGHDKLGNHPLEGIVLRVEHPGVSAAMSLQKMKTDLFNYLENGTRNDSNFIDVEEIS